MSSAVRDVDGRSRSQRPVSRNGGLTILHVTAPGAVGGLESVVLGLATGHQALGHTVHVAAVMDGHQHGLPFVEELSATGVSVHPVHVPPRGYRRERREIRNLCKRLRPDVVHTHGPRPDVLDAGVARRLGIPTVTTVHGSSRMGGVTVLHEWLEWRAFRRFDAVVAVSQQLAEHLRRKGIRADRVHTVINAWSPRAPFLDRATARRELGVADGAFHVGWVGRLIRAKGCDLFLRALCLLEDLPLVVSVIGDGIERSALYAMAEARGLAQRVRFHGTVSQAARLYRAFDVFVLSSRTEGTPIVLLEAMAAEVPVVVTRVGGVPGVVTDREAVLVSPNDPRAMATAIRSSLRDGSAAHGRAQAAKRRLNEMFGSAKWLEDYETVYQQVTARPRTESPT